ncbi:MAG: dihydrodipicolinate synthase family protein [Thermaerobacter sp.]|nr:dihydrodipicolinate synthase family protein [Thermaerobacter sp.]
MLDHIIPIALTPFHDDGGLDLDSIPTLQAFYRRQGASALIVLGIMGEAHALSDQEREAVIAAYVATSGDLPIIATVSAPATEVACERARRARQLGAHYVMAAPPPGVTDVTQLTRHFSQIATAADCPWVLQDEPVTTGVRLPPDVIASLATAVPSLTAVKVEDVPTPSKIDALHRLLPKTDLFGGLGGLYLFEELQHGARGSMTGFSYPDILGRVMDRFAYDAEGARALFYQYLPLIRYEAQLGVRGIAIRKALFYRRGLIASPVVRAPAAPADPVIQADLLDLVKALRLPLTAQEGPV